MKSYKHNDNRFLIPSREEVGYEDASQVVSDKKEVKYSFNLVLHYGYLLELCCLCDQENQEVLLLL